MKATCSTMRYFILFLIFLGISDTVFAQSDSSKEKGLQARRTIMMANAHNINLILNKNLKQSLIESDKKNALDIASFKKTALKTFSIHNNMEALAEVRATQYILENSKSIKDKKKQ